jgi:hypothetical protein
MSEFRPVLERLREDLVPPTDPIKGFESLHSLRRRRSLRRRIAAAGLAGVVALAGFGALVVAFSGDPRVDGEQPAAEGWSGYGPGWTQLPGDGLPGSAWAWTGSELVGGGGQEDGAQRPAASGAGFDPTTGTWTPIPDAPEGRTDAHAVWTGREILFWGGWDGEAERMDGLAFDLASGEWRKIPDAPLSAGSTAVSVWTGTEMIVWGGGEPGSVRAQKGAAYDPGTDSWRELPLAPIGLNHADGVWTGHEMVVFGSLLNGQNIASSETAIGARYDPRTDRWKELPPSDLSPQATALGVLGDELVAYDYDVRSQTYNLEGGQWGDTSKMPMSFSECYPDIATLPDVAFAFFCGQAATYAPGQGWKRVMGGMLDETLKVDGDAYQLYRFATIVPVGEGIVFAAEGITTTDRGEVCYGCPGAPRALWLWRPT